MRVQRNQDRLVVHLGKRETHLFLEVLKLYPCIPPAHHRVSRSGRERQPADSQRLLDEALAEQRGQNQRNLQGLLNDSKRVRRDESGCRLSLSAGDAEWLLQVLNDIRVGSWLQLGAPEEKLELAVLDEKTAPHFWAMEVSGQFQAQLLHAMEQT